MIKKTAAALAALALASVLVGCNNSDDDCYDDEATGAGIELVALGDGKSGGSSGGGSRGGGGSKSGGSKPGSKAKPGKGVGAGVAAGVAGHDDCDDD